MKEKSVVVSVKLKKWFLTLEGKNDDKHSPKKNPENMPHAPN